MSYQERVNNRLRTEWYERAEYWAWMARRDRIPTALDPVAGRPWPVLWSDHPASMAVRKVGRAAYAAMAREAYASARMYPNPLPEDRNAARLEWECAEDVA